MRKSLLLCVATLSFIVPRPAEAQSHGTAELSGRVFRDPSLQPIAEAEVSILELQKSVLSDAKGGYLINGIPPGTYTVRARRVGFALYESRVEFRAEKTVERPIVLPALTVLDSVRVVGDVNVPLSFLEHRAVGLGHFLTRDDLAKQENISLQNILAQVSGLGVARGRGGQGWILSKRVVPRLSTLSTRGNAGAEMGRDFYFPDSTEARQGMKTGCYARVYLDNLLLNPTTPADPINLNDYSARNIEAIEYYSGPSQTPMQYSRLNSTCGVLVMHTRKSR